MNGGKGELSVKQGSSANARLGSGTRNEWDVRLNAEGLTREGNSYVNDAYGDSDVTLEVDVEGGVGEINLEVV